MSCVSQSFHSILIVLAVALCAVGCRPNQPPASTAASTPVAEAPLQDPAAANLAPVSDNAASNAPAPSPDVPRDSGGSSQLASELPPDDAGYAEQPVATAPKPPPPLPDYDQPPCPGGDYIWTPGYWSYAPTGYYWVPGAWVAPPYTGALWTPGYWSFSNSAYTFYPGHWGSHLGYYGGINYGFGYFGSGYEGGYWNDGHFYHNRQIDNVNINKISNVYSYNIGDHPKTFTRESFNGGPGGIQSRPKPAEVAAWREPYAPRMTSQVQHEQSFSSHKGQFAAVTSGHPADPSIDHPLEADRDVKPLPARDLARQHPGPPPGKSSRPFEREQSPKPTSTPAHRPGERH